MFQVLSENFFGDDLYMGDEERYGGKTGYQKDGTFIDKFGNVSAGGWDEDWKDLVRTDPEKAGGRLAKTKIKGSWLYWWFVKRKIMILQ